MGALCSQPICGICGPLQAGSAEHTFRGRVYVNHGGVVYSQIRDVGYKQVKPLPLP
jgi:hypothetical protein